MARWQPDGNNEDHASTILPRYRRLLTIGALLDESIQLFRQHWITLALFATIALVPSWVLVLLTYAAGYRQVIQSAATGGALESLPLIGALGGLSLLAGLVTLLWSAASIAAADELVHGQRPTVRSIYGRALGRYLAMLGCLVLYVIAVIGLTIGAAVLFALTIFGTLGTLIALIGLIYWWRTPDRRRPWLKWLIILTAPFGLLTYFTVRWAVWLPAIVLERRGPIAALERSWKLTDREWFRSFAVLILTSIIVVVLVSVPVSVVDIVFTLVVRTRDPLSSQDALQLVNSTVSSICQVLFSSIAGFAYVLLFVDLRNRREGTDLGERIGSLEAAPI